MGKLIRDLMPDIIERETGVRPKTRVLKEGKELVRALKAKVVEEALEVQSAHKRKDVRIELADLHQAAESLRAALNISMRDLEGEIRRRQRVRGVFERRLST